MYGRDSEMLLLRCNHKMASFTLVEGCDYALIRIKPALRRIAVSLRRRWSRRLVSKYRAALRRALYVHTPCAGHRIVARLGHPANNVESVIDRMKGFL
jgi:hypothetical protein